MITFANFDRLKRRLSGRELSLNASYHYSRSQPLILSIYELHPYLSYADRYLQINDSYIFLSGCSFKYYIQFHSYIVFHLRSIWFKYKYCHATLFWLIYFLSLYFGLFHSFCF